MEKFRIFLCTGAWLPMGMPTYGTQLHRLISRSLLVQRVCCTQRCYGRENRGQANKSRKQKRTHKDAELVTGLHCNGNDFESNTKPRSRDSMVSGVLMHSRIRVTVHSYVSTPQSPDTLYVRELQPAFRVLFARKCVRVHSSLT